MPRPSRASLYRLLASISVGRRRDVAAATRRFLAKRPPTCPSTSSADFDERLRPAAAKPVIEANPVTYDRGRSYTSQNYPDSCHALGMSVPAAHPYTPADKTDVERVLAPVNTVWWRLITGNTGHDTTGDAH